MTEGLEALYASITARGLQAIATGRESVDPVLAGAGPDGRRGLSLLIPLGRPRPGNPDGNGMPQLGLASMLGTAGSAIRAIDPAQYCYPPGDLHVTVVTLVSGRKGFSPDDSFLAACIEAVGEAVDRCAPFELSFRGLVASEAAVLAGGYYDGGLARLREEVRAACARHGIEPQERYRSISAHTTLARFATPLVRRRELAEFVQRNTATEFGSIIVGDLELTVNDWYNRIRRDVAWFRL